MARPKKPSRSVEELEAILAEHLKNAPAPAPSIGAAILSDATPAAIPKFIKENCVQSLGIISAEAEEFLNKGIKHQSSTLNKGFSGEKTDKHLAGRGDESYDIPMTTLLFGQPKVMEKAFGGENNKMRGTGTIARGLFSFPASNVGFRPYQSNTTIGEMIGKFASNGPSDPQRYHRWASEMLHMNQCQLANGAKRTPLRLSQEALDHWYLGRAEVELQLRPGGRYAEHRDHGNRLPEQWLRVAAVLHGYNHGLDGDISLSTLKLAILLVNCFSTEYQRIFSHTSQEDKDLMTLGQWIEEKRHQNRRYIAKSFVTTGTSLRPVSRLNIALRTLHQNRQIGILEVPCKNHKGQATKPMTVIDLFPGDPVNAWLLELAVFEARQLNNG